MTNIDLGVLSQIILDGIFDRELDKQIRTDILDNVPEKQYELACKAFLATRQAYFDFSFIDGVYDLEKGIQTRTNILDNVPKKHYKIACKVFDTTCQAYFDLGFEIRNILQ